MSEFGWNLALIVCSVSGFIWFCTSPKTVVFLGTVLGLGYAFTDGGGVFSTLIGLVAGVVVGGVLCLPILGLQHLTGWALEGDDMAKWQARQTKKVPASPRQQAPKQAA